MTQSLHITRQRVSGLTGTQTLDSAVRKAYVASRLHRVTNDLTLKIEPYKIKFHQRNENPRQNQFTQSYQSKFFSKL